MERVLHVLVRLLAEDRLILPEAQAPQQTAMSMIAPR